MGLKQCIYCNTLVVGRQQFCFMVKSGEKFGSLFRLIALREEFISNKVDVREAIFQIQIILYV